MYNTDIMKMSGFIHINLPLGSFAAIEESIRFFLFSVPVETKFVNNYFVLNKTLHYNGIKH